MAIIIIKNGNPLINMNFLNKGICNVFLEKEHIPLDLSAC